MEMRKCINSAYLTGVVVSEIEFVKEFFHEKIYQFTLAVKRMSGTEDLINVQASERVMDINKVWLGEIISVYGEFRSHNVLVGDKKRMLLNVFAAQVRKADENEDANIITLRGYICKPPVYRKTPLGREITDIFIAINRPSGRADYIPCISWGRNAGYLADIEVGTFIEFTGRIQSREFVKDEETRTAYEVSISGIREGFTDEEDTD